MASPTDLFSAYADTFMNKVSNFITSYQFPAAHRIHHPRQPAHYNKNFRATLIVWDKMFGTLHPDSSSSARQLPIGDLTIRDRPRCATCWTFIVNSL